jgi:hypothetical protein
MADGYWESWLVNIGRLRTELAPDAELHFGHGDPAATPALDWQEGYINAFMEAVQDAPWSDSDKAKDEVVRRMTEYLPAGELQFLMELSIEPVAAKLGLTASRTESASPDGGEFRRTGGLPRRGLRS